MHHTRLILKTAVFATGCAGIVAEFVLSTLATYLSGDAVLQWTVVMSLMLFSMGVGSRISKRIHKQLLDVFILVEFILSLMCAASAMVSYGLAAYITQIHLLIYAWAMGVGCLIGLEIPLVTRINQKYETLRVNIASVLEKDYYGSLIGGFFFAFFALPYLGVTYTPVILGAINFLVASLFIGFLFNLVTYKKTILTVFILCVVALIGITAGSRPVILFGEQRQYKDKIIFSRQTPYQKIVMTQFKDYYWLYINGQQQFSSFDEEKYHEPLIHPAMKLARDRRRVLILGGGDGLALREIWKYPDVEWVTLVDLDPEMVRIAAEHPVLVALNQGSMKDSRLHVVHGDAKAFLVADASYYNLIFIDLPDPDTIDLMHVYSRGFYELVRHHLSPGGILVTQAASPYFAEQAFQCIIKTIESARFAAVPYHNQIPTMGEWGWVLAVPTPGGTPARLKQHLEKLDFSDTPTRFINQDALISMLHFGKGILDSEKMAGIKVNTELNPVLYQYYQKGTWAMY